MLQECDPWLLMFIIELMLLLSNAALISIVMRSECDGVTELPWLTAADFPL
jgi:hypothetical protein